MWRGLHLTLAGINVFMRINTFDLSKIIWKHLSFNHNDSGRVGLDPGRKEESIIFLVSREQQG